MTEEGRNDIQLERFSGGPPVWIDVRSASYSAHRTLKFVRVHSRNQPVVIQVVKRLVNTGKVLKVRKHQELAIAISFCLIHGQRPGRVLIVVGRGPTA